MNLGRAAFSPGSFSPGMLLPAPHLPPPPPFAFSHIISANWRIWGSRGGGGSGSFSQALSVRGTRHRSTSPHPSLKLVFTPVIFCA